MRGTSRGWWMRGERDWCIYSPVLSFSPETEAEVTFLCDCSSQQAALPHSPSSHWAPGNTFCFPLPSASKWEGWGWALSDSPSHICSLNLAHTCVRNPFLKLSSSELFGSKFYFLLYLWLINEIIRRRPNISKVFRMLFYISKLSRWFQLYSIVSNLSPHQFY